MTPANRIGDLPVHPACDLFPLMDAASAAKLAADIRANGLLNSIVLHEGQIVDGRNRLLACREAGVEPRFVEWSAAYTGDMSIARWIWSSNVERRHMSTDQIAAVEVAMRAYEKQQEAHKRQTEGQKRGGETAGRGRPKANSSVLNSAQSYAAASDEPQAPGRVCEQIATEAGLTVHKVRQALEVQKADPALLREVAHGIVSLREAQKRAKAQTEVPPQEAPSKPPSKRQQMFENAAKDKLIEILSHVRGLCSGLSRIDPNAIRNCCTPDEIETWAGIAREQARLLRQFSLSLTKAKGSN
jgi:hypothetical protein